MLGNGRFIYILVAVVFAYIVGVIADSWWLLGLGAAFQAFWLADMVYRRLHDI